MAGYHLTPGILGGYQWAPGAGSGNEFMPTHGWDHPGYHLVPDPLGGERWMPNASAGAIAQVRPPLRDGIFGAMPSWVSKPNLGIGGDSWRQNREDWVASRRPAPVPVDPISAYLATAPEAPAAPNINLEELMNRKDVQRIVSSMISQQNRPLKNQRRQVEADTRNRVKLAGQVEEGFQRGHRRIMQGAAQAGREFSRSVRENVAGVEADRQRVMDELNGLSAGGYNADVASKMVASQEGTHRASRALSGSAQRAGNEGHRASVDMLQGLAAASALQTKDRQNDVRGDGSKAVREILSQIAANRVAAPNLRMSVAQQLAQQMSSNYQNQLAGYDRQRSNWETGLNAQIALGTAEAKAAGKVPKVKDVRSNIEDALITKTADDDGKMQSGFKAPKDDAKFLNGMLQEYGVENKAIVLRAYRQILRRYGYRMGSVKWTSNGWAMRSK